MTCVTGKGGWEDRSDVSCPARPSAQELRELASRRALGGLTLSTDWLCLWLGAEGYCLLEWAGFKSLLIVSWQSAWRANRVNS